MGTSCRRRCWRYRIKRRQAPHGVLAIVGFSGTGNIAKVTSPSFTTPTYGVATATSITKWAITAPATSSTLAVADGKTLTASNTLTLAGTDSTTMTFPTTSATIARTDASNTFTGHQTIEGVTSTPVATGTALLVFGTSPTLTTPSHRALNDVNGNASPYPRVDYASAALRRAPARRRGRPRPDPAVRPDWKTSTTYVGHRPGAGQSGGRRDTRGPPPASGCASCRERSR